MEIKDEFKQYVAELTETICKDIFMSRLEEICKKYENLVLQYQQIQSEYDKVTQSVSSNNQQLTSNNQQLNQAALKVEEATRDLDVFTSEINATIKHMDSEIDGFKDKMNLMFEQVAKDSNLNRNEFVNEVQSEFDQQKKQFDDIFVKGCKSIETELKSIVDAARLKEFMDRVTSNTNEMKVMADFIRGTYKEEVAGSIQEILKNTQEKQECLNAYMEKKVQSLTEDIDKIKGLSKAEIDSKMEAIQQKLQEQEKSFVQRLSNVLLDEKYDRTQLYEEHVGFLTIEKESLVEQHMELKNTLIMYQARFEEIEEKYKRNDASWRIYLTGTINFIIVLFGINIVLQKPWEMFGMQNSLILTAGLSGAFLIILILKVFVANHKKKKKDVNI